MLKGILSFKNRRPIEITGIVLKAVIVAGLILDIVLLASLNSVAGKRTLIVQRENQGLNVVADSGLEAIGDDPLDLHNEVEFGRVEKINMPIYATERLKKYVFNVLFVAESETEPDIFLLFSYNSALQKISVISFLRDCWMPSEEGGYNRLSYMYDRGGIGLLTNTLNDTFGLDIQNYAVIEMNDLAGIIDDLGGVELTLTEEERIYIEDTTGRKVPKEEKVTLTGKQALAYATDRTSGGGGDFARGERQLNLVHAGLNEIRKKSDLEKEMLSLLKKILVDLKTNVSPSMLGDLGKEIIKADSIKYLAEVIPQDGTWNYAKADGSIVISLDYAANREYLLERLYAE